MEIYASLLIALLSATSETYDPMPLDVAEFIEERDGCDHFRGEPPYSEERRRFLEKNIRDLCTGTDRKLSDLKKKYSEYPLIIDALSIYEEDIEVNQ